MRKATDQIYNKDNESAIKEYLGLEEEWCNVFFKKWKPTIDKAIDKARENLADYILESDYGIYDEGNFIANMDGIIIFKKEHLS